MEVDRIGRVARFTLNRPEKRNALNADTCRQMLEAFDRAEADSGVGCVLLQGNGPSFCAGMDLAEVLSADPDELVNLHERLFTVIDRARKPIVAAVHGAAIAAGTGLAANSHIVIASPDAKFALTEVRIGLWPVIVFRSVVRAVGERRATELSITGRMVGAEEALSFGLVTEIVDDPQKRALEIAQQVAGFSPTVMALGLDHVAKTRGLSWPETNPIDRRMRAELMTAPDFAEGVKAFLEKRRPEWPSLKD